MEDNTVTAVEPKEKTAQTGKAVKKDKKEKKPGFFKELKKEFKKVVFADKNPVAKQTVAVVTMSIFIGALIAVLDFVLKFGLGFIL